MIVFIYHHTHYFLIILWILLLFRAILVPSFIRKGKNISIKTIGILEIVLSVLLFIALL